MLRRSKVNERGKTVEKRNVYTTESESYQVQARYLTFPVELLRGERCICSLRSPVPLFGEPPLLGFS